MKPLLVIWSVLLGSIAAAYSCDSRNMTMCTAPSCIRVTLAYGEGINTTQQCMPFAESLKKTLKISESEDGSAYEATVKVPFCRPQIESGNMPTFWRGFWPWAGGAKREWDEISDKWEIKDNMRRTDIFTQSYRPCNTWDKTPQCSILSIIDKIQQHPSNKVKQLRADWQRETFVNPLSSDCGSDQMPINSFKIATAWSRLTWMQRHVLRVWEHTNYCANVWDYSGNYYGKKFRATDPDHQTATQFDTVRPEKTPLNEDYDEWGVARKFCTCPPGSSDPLNYPEVFGKSFNKKKTGCKKKVGNKDDEILPEGHCKPNKREDLAEGVLDQYYGAQDGCKALIPGFLPNDTFLIGCDSTLPWDNGHHKELIVEDRDITKYPIRRWIMGVPEPWFFGRFPDPEIMAANKKPVKKIHIHDWYYNDGRIDGMYGANAHYPGNFPVKKNRNPLKELLLRTRAAPRNMRLATHGDNVGAAKNPWVTKDQRNFFQIKHVPIQEAIKKMP